MIRRAAPDRFLWVGLGDGQAKSGGCANAGGKLKCPGARECFRGVGLCGGHLTYFGTGQNKAPEWMRPEGTGAWKWMSGSCKRAPAAVGGRYLVWGLLACVVVYLALEKFFEGLRRPSCGRGKPAKIANADRRQGVRPGKDTRITD